MMQASLLLFALLLAVGIYSASGLKCRSDEDSQSSDEFQEVALLCMSNSTKSDRGQNRRNRHNNRNYGTMDYDQDGGYDDQRGNKRNNNGRPRHRQRNKRQSGRGDQPGQGLPLEQIEPCVVHCIFRQMEMLDDDSMPEKESVTNVMMRRVKDPQVKDFIEEAIDECFEQMESDTKGSKCDYSKNMALCLQEKGRQNCEDWDEPQENGSDKKMKNENHNYHNGNYHGQNRNNKWNQPHNPN